MLRAIGFAIIFAILFVFMEPTTTAYLQPVGGDMIHNGTRYLYVTGNNISFNNGEVLWKYKMPNSWWMGPAIDINGTLYVYGKNAENNSYGLTLFSLNTEGKLIWNTTVIKGDLDPSSGPALGKNNTVYVTTFYFPPTFGAVNFLYAFSSLNGELLWKFNFGRNGPFSDPVIGKDGSIYIAAFGDKSIIYTINPDGTPRWKLEEDTRNASVIGPVLGLDDTVYFVYDTPHTCTLYALNPSDGSLKWKYDIQKKPYTFAEYPVVDKDGTIYISTDQDCLYAISSNGALKWKVNITGYSGPPTIGLDGTLYLTHYLFTDHRIYLYAIDSKNGDVLWKRFIGDDLGEPRSKIYIGKENTVCVSSNDTIYAFNKDGKLMGEIKANKDIILRGIGKNDELYVKSGSYLYALVMFMKDNCGKENENFLWIYYSAAIGVISGVAVAVIYRFKKRW